MNDPALMPAVVRRLDQGGIAVAELALRRSTLDEVFLALTGHRTEPETGRGEESVAGEGEFEKVGSSACRRDTSAFVRVETMPGWLQAWVDINPVTHLSDAFRGLLVGGEVASPVLWSPVWAAGIAVVFYPMVMQAYRSRT